MSLPKHKNPADPKREANAPYNFVPLPEKVAAVDPASLPDHDRYQPNRYTGSIEVTLTTESPLYIRCGESPAEFSKENKKQSPEFFTDPVSGQPIIPGSSLRGMLRAMVEIVSYGKVQPVSSQKLFYRAVADTMTTLRESYHEQLNKAQAGYVEEHHGNYFVRPAKTVGESTFLKVNEKILRAGGVKFISILDPKYQPQYIDCWFRPSDKYIDSVGEVSPTEKSGYQKGMLICSGPFGNKKRKHWIVPVANTYADSLPIPEAVVREYVDTLTEYQKEKPFSPKTGCLIPGRPLFYLEQDNTVIDFGPTRNFRVAYRKPGEYAALSAHDFVPDSLQTPGQTDFAEALFGYVEQQKNISRPLARAGRLSFSDALLASHQDIQSLWWAGTPEKSITPKILSGPKPTTFANYLTQKNPDYLQRIGKDKKTRNFLNLSHYASPTPNETVIRGHKLYWHKGANPAIENDKPDASESQLTQIKPLKPGVMFNFSIKFENLNLVELGALLWPLHLGGQDGYRLKLGMGKPLGMGSVRTEAVLHLTNRQERYTGLFSGNNWQLGLQLNQQEVALQARQEFEQFILSHEADAFSGEGRLNQLKALLSWPGPEPDKTRYMTIQPNEFKDRKVLPTPTHVLNGPSPKGQSAGSSAMASGPDRSVPSDRGRKDSPRSPRQGGPGSPQPMRADREQVTARPAAAQSAFTAGNPPKVGLNLPQAGDIFTGNIQSIRPDGTVIIQYKNMPLKQVRAIIASENLAGKNYTTGSPARCEVISIREEFGVQVIECKPGPKKEKGK